mgnify:CR=1 FL=1
MVGKKKNTGMVRLMSIFGSNGKLMAGCTMLLLLILAAIFAPFITTRSPYVLGSDLLLPPGEKYPLGTDGLGRDVYSMLIYGIRTSLLVGVVAALISAVLGVLFGAFSGYYGGRFDQVFTEINNIFLMLPAFFLVLIIVALFGSSLLNVMIVIGLTSWPSNARLMRAQAMSLRERTFVRSALAIGESRSRIVFRYIIPNGIFPVVANTTMGIGGAILTEAGLSFLGLGDPNVVSWGQMINQGRAYLSTGWWVSTFAGAATLIVVLIFYLIGDGINEILNPKPQKES